ncbi:Flagellar radial spoke protein 4 [Diplonema papillatum]|nr:Flagellar radial spoke protein 4 [Diplonema papillatum]KAJ9468223.1 Flagellar radial spoke protein 4 [Diplonema papillatum]KAJ9468224.1 Flagellar radial spoke protein 4 [Diplonema papillatum]
MSEDFNKAKAFLQKADGEGYSVYDHVFNLVSNAVEKNAGMLKNTGKLPDFSRQVKGHRFKGETPVGQAPAKVAIDRRDVERAREEKALLKVPESAVKTEITRPTPFTVVTTTTVKPVVGPSWRPVTEDQRYHRLAGIGLPRREYLLIEQSIAKLAREKKLEDVQFFGKVFGTKGNYLVAVSRRHFADETETMWQERYAMPKPPRKGLEVPIQQEPPGVGLNMVTFWVAGHAGAEWVDLPDVTPQQIGVSRQIKKFLTGSLDAEVNSYPVFPGNEKNYLRAQLARIWCATTIAPEGEVEVFEDDEEEPEDDEDADPNAPKPLKYRPLVTAPKPVPVDDGIASLASRDKWVHKGPYLYKTGRGSLLPPKPEPADGEEEPAEEEEDEEEKEPLEEEKKELLQPISGDVRYAVVRVPPEPKADDDDDAEDAEEKEPEEENNDDEEEDNPRKFTMHAWAPGTVNNLYKMHGVVVVKSLRWPGAVSWVSAGGVSGCLYLGDGLKATDSAFAPALPPPVQSEVDDIKEMPDPTSMSEKLILRGEEPKEADSEDEKEDEEEEAQE